LANGGYILSQFKLTEKSRAIQSKGKSKGLALSHLSFSFSFPKRLQAISTLRWKIKLVECAIPFFKGKQSKCCQYSLNPAAVKVAVNMRPQLSQFRKISNTGHFLHEKTMICSLRRVRKGGS